MIPIPRAMLPHSATLESITEEDDWQKPIYGNPVTLEYIKIDPTRTLKTDSQNRQVQLSAILFYDCFNSFPKVEFIEGQRVNFRGRVYKVETVETLFENRDQPHHYEVGLS